MLTLTRVIESTICDTGNHTSAVAYALASCLRACAPYPRAPNNHIAETNEFLFDANTVFHFNTGLNFPLTVADALASIGANSELHADNITPANLHDYLYYYEQAHAKHLPEAKPLASMPQALYAVIVACDPCSYNNAVIDFIIPAGLLRIANHSTY